MGLVFHCTRRQRQCNGKAYINAAFVGRKLESDYWKIASSAETGDVSERVAVRNTKSRVREGADEDCYRGVDESTTKLRQRELWAGACGYKIPGGPSIAARAREHNAADD